ncbi:penicillin acylase family protein [Streptomyces phaeochromogenes]|uniref:penicillin acylase family protein n=1 Tax=Streptomyces phaeochromogenes TaxID=1923 RepID=UPI0036BF71F4
MEGAVHGGGPGAHPEHAEHGRAGSSRCGTRRRAATARSAWVRATSRRSAGTAAAARTLLTYSQSSNPNSDHCADQTRLFSREKLGDVPLLREGHPLLARAEGGAGARVGRHTCGPAPCWAGPHACAPAPRRR